METKPNMEAAVSASQPLLHRSVGSAPLARRRAATSSCPHSAALMRAVMPQWLARLTDAPRSSRREVACTRPLLAATCGEDEEEEELQVRGGKTGAAGKRCR